MQTPKRLGWGRGIHIVDIPPCLDEVIFTFLLSKAASRRSPLFKTVWQSVTDHIWGCLNQSIHYFEVWDPIKNYPWIHFPRRKPLLNPLSNYNWGYWIMCCFDVEAIESYYNCWLAAQCSYLQLLYFRTNTCSKSQDTSPATNILCWYNHLNAKLSQLWTPPEIHHN